MGVKIRRKRRRNLYGIGVILFLTLLIFLLFPMKSEVDAIKLGSKWREVVSFRSSLFLKEKIINPELGEYWLKRLKEIKQKNSEIVGKDPSVEKEGKENEDRLGTDRDQSTPPPPTNQTPTNTDKTVYLTFDDGPDRITPTILDLLSKYNVKATFFMLEPSMKQYPQTVQRVVEEGHKIGMHSVTHDKKKYYLNIQTVVGEMVQGQETLKELTGTNSQLIRTPYGSKPHMTKEYIHAIENAGFKMWDWNIDSEDWKLTDGSFVQNTIQQMTNFKRQEPYVILLHDRETTAQHLEKLLQYLINNGYKMDVIREDMNPVQLH